jgi:transcriptional regulator with XRE-family HTH domain
LLTSGEIIEGRKKLKLSQEELAEQMHIGIASVKRWEGSAIQSKSMDKMLRAALADDNVCGDPYTGNRTLSIPRVKLVLTHFEARLNRKILKKNDRMLFAAKYLWYADMAAFREYGEGMTGATYAALPYGPQMNNYGDLIDDILTVDVKRAEPLSEGEERIIEKITAAFPKDRMVYDAAHRERVWEEKSTGALITYTDATRLTEV